MDQATTSGFRKNQFMIMAAFGVIVIVGAFAYFNGYFGGTTANAPIPAKVGATTP
jgi:hypothetical protein